MWIILEHMMCFGDAATMVGEGRSYAAADCVTEMENVLGGFGGEEVLNKLTEKENREKIASLIREAQNYEAKACEELKNIILMIE